MDMVMVTGAGVEWRSKPWELRGEGGREEHTLKLHRWMGRVGVMKKTDLGTSVFSG